MRDASEDNYDMRGNLERIMLAIVIAPMAFLFFLIACTMAGPREARKILKRN